MPNTPVQPEVPHFDSVEALREGLRAKSNFENVDLYPRDGSTLLGEVETHIAQLVGVQSKDLLVYGSGMSALTDSVDVALHASISPAPTVACARETYSQSQLYIKNFISNKRAKVVYFDSGDNDSIARVIDTKQPDVILTESISNFVNVPVTDTDFLFEYAKSQEKVPYVVIDNTLPLSTALPLGEKLLVDDKIIVAESGTKSYSLNAELLGIAYTKNTALADYLRRYRRTRGTLPGLQSLDLISQCLPEDRQAFDERNLKLFKSTGEIALRLSALAGENHDFIFSHPGLPHHDNHDLYVQQYPRHGTPLFYIQSGVFNQYEVAERLWTNPDVRAQAQLGQSFGFDHTRIVADENVGAVRISGGAETDGQILGEALAEALFT